MTSFKDLFRFRSSIMRFVVVVLVALTAPATVFAQDAAPATIYLPLVANSSQASAQAEPDLLFIPNGLTLEKGGSVTTTVTVSPLASLISATFALSDTTDVDGISGDGSKGWVGAVQLKVTPRVTAKTIFVDAVNGSDANDGSQTKPFKTIGKALTLANSGDTVKLAQGHYTPDINGETYPLTVPTGVGRI
jgi:hypothetical protein